jgi:PAS domain S-box-containing protein
MAQLKPIGDLLSISQACALLQCHPNTLRYWDKIGVLKAIRFGKRGDRRYKREDILKLLEKDQPQQVVNHGNHAEEFFKLELNNALEKVGHFQFLINSLSNLLTPVETADLIIKQGMQAMNAQSGLIALVQNNGTMLHILHAVGFKKRELKPWNNLPLAAPIHLADAIRSGHVIFIESIEEGKIRYPLTTKLAEASNNLAFAAAPLMLNNQTTGVLCLSFSNPRRFSESDRLFLQSIAGQCAQALERAHLYDELRLREENYRLIVEQVKDYAIFTMDKRGNVTTWNKGGERILQFSEKEIIGKNYSSFFAPEEKKTNKPVRELESALRKGSVENENWTVRKDKSQFWASGITTAIEDSKGKHIGFIKILRDQSEAKQIEKEKDHFVSLVSHELKNPLTSLIAFSQLLEKRLEKHKDAMSLKYLSHIQSQTSKITHLITNLLEQSKARAHGFTFNDTNFLIDDLVNEVIENTKRSKATHKIILQGKVKKKITADRERIGQVLDNLLSNAIKYSPDGDRVIVKVSGAKDIVTISVQDFGVGIPKDSINKIFKPFFRATQSQRESFPSMGLGLYIAAEIVKHYKGKIWIESEEQKGSTFRFSLPL